jgi:hypothetical protein
MLSEPHFLRPCLTQTPDCSCQPMCRLRFTRAHPARVQIFSGQDLITELDSAIAEAEDAKVSAKYGKKCRKRLTAALQTLEVRETKSTTDGHLPNGVKGAPADRPNGSREDLEGLLGSSIGGSAFVLHPLTPQSRKLSSRSAGEQERQPIREPASGKENQEVIPH